MTQTIFSMRFVWSVPINKGMMWTNSNVETLRLYSETCSCDHLYPSIQRPLGHVVLFKRLPLFKDHFFLDSAVVCLILQVSLYNVQHGCETDVFSLFQPLQQRFAFHFRAAIKHPNPTFLQNRSPPNHFHLSSKRFFQ